jgi:tetratricopeptide (TPR) repeat protein
VNAARGRLLALARSRWQLAAILALALGLRLLLWSQPPHEPANDEVEYIAVARDLLAGRGWVFYESYRWLRAPLYPLFLAGSLWLAGGDLHLAALPNIALSVLNVYLSYRLALALVGGRAAPLAALISAALLTLATFGSLYMAETLFTGMFLAGLLCALRASESRRVRVIAAWSLAAGLFFGLATLTRSITLLFLPLLALWLLFGRTPAPLQGDAGERAESEPSSPLHLWSLVTRRWVAPALLLGAAALVIAPWSIRNTLAYGEPILVETGLSYNLWVFSEPRESQSEIHRTLEGIANPAERADYATARGLERLREDPAIVLRKLWPNWVFLARVKPIQDRFLLESYYQSVDLPPFVAALLFDDLLYVVVALAAIAGLARAAGAEVPRGAPRRLHHLWPAVIGRPAWLVLAWIGYVLLTTLLTHGEARYRHFLFPALIPYAAAFLAGRSRTTGGRTLGARLRRPGALLVAALWAVFLWTVATSYPRDWALQNVARGWHTLIGDGLLAAGDSAGAQRAYERAIAAQSAPDPWLRLGHARRVAGDLAGAAEAYRQAWRREPLYYPASTWYGDALRALGDDERAREAFAGSYADPQRVTDYAWRALRPPDARALDVGGGLDFGYLRGVYPAEVIDGASARWSDGRAELRLAAPEATGVLRLRLAAPRTDQQVADVSVCAGGACRALEVGAGWRTYELPLAGGGAPLTFEVRSDTFRGPDGRELGVLIDRAEVE